MSPFSLKNNLVNYYIVEIGYTVEIGHALSLQNLFPNRLVISFLNRTQVRQLKLSTILNTP